MDRQDDRHVAVLLTGGTVQLEAGLATADYAEDARWVSNQTMRRLVRSATSSAVRVSQVFRSLGSEMTIEAWHLLATRIAAELAKERVAGVVITHGTDTLEEAALYLALTITARKPIVVTGAMRPFGASGADAPKNIADAISVCLDDSPKARRVTLVEAGRIFDAADVTKVDPSRVGGFVSPHRGPIGRVSGGRVIWRRGLITGPVVAPFGSSGHLRIPRVDIVDSYPGADGTLAEAAWRAGARGIVVGAMGAGYMPWAQENALRGLVKRGLSVCIASRTALGGVSQRRSLQEGDFLVAGTLRPWKARIVLALALGQRVDLRDQQRALDSLQTL